MQGKHISSPQQTDIALPEFSFPYPPTRHAPARTATTPILSFPMALRRVTFLMEKHLVARWEIVSDYGTMRVLGDAERSVYRAYCGTNCAQSHSLTKLANEILRVYPEFWDRSWTILPEVSWTTVDQAKYT